LFHLNLGGHKHKDTSYYCLDFDYFL